ncbi:glycoside hydrolase family 71 protein [Hydnum rufescens UP504]|uniref:Glycoside hydrolase family 71 protein n=1 Tax=Hydnum rufescens UP504 TaxID=1448309 RepID=A0A9P6B2C9_9AGAM|nr:glycoside hydrolase family 71 protein [Hydnum rufescens UP504]
MVGNAYSYIQSTWSTNIAAAMSGGIDGFALNVGADSWALSRVSDAYAAAAGTSFKLFLSFDMTSLPCASPGDATVLRQYISTYANHPNQLYYQGKLIVSSFSGQDCTFGQGDINSGWNYAIKTTAPQPVAFIPSFFSGTSSFASTPVMDGEFNWNGGWPMSDSDIDFSSDQTFISAIGGRYRIAAVSPVFFTHYGVNTYNKNWIYRSDDWLYNTRWELLIEKRAQIDMVEIITWNDYGESHYIGPIGADQPNSQAWVNGFDHQGWNIMTKYYADAWRTGVYPTITKNRIFLSSRPHSRDLTINDPIGKPSNWQWTDDYLYAVVFATGPGSLRLSIGSSSSTTDINAGVNKIKLALSPGSPTAVLFDSGGNTILTFSPSGFTYITNPSAYNFNYYMAASP